ncbi:flippase [Undibacterium sp.]|jgi:O-antigen/teichoic acid export membrane protein|uniref:flippase n=1 Tax=Undibacterium sp. TaxID=1914977 RepID=UPI002BC0E46E|nr:flippase [Undibacterium sp.]HTD06138.1 flippase [Undibacterium sp.]
MSHKKNVLWNLAGSGLPLLAAAVFIPYCVRHLGNESFGVLTLIWALIGYFSLFDFGAGRALTYEISKLRAAGQTDAIQPIFKAGLLMTLLTGALGTLVMLLLAPYLAQSWLKISPHLQADAQTAFQIAAAAVIPTAVTSGLRGAMEGLDQFLASNINRVFLGFCMFVLPALSIYLHGPGLWQIAAYLALARVIVVAIGFFQLRAYLRHSSTAATASLMQRMRSLTSYGLWLVVTGIIGPLMIYGDRFFVSAAVGADQLAMYSIPQEGLIRLLIIPTAICGALLPLFAGLSSRQELATSYYRNYRRVGGIMLAVCLSAGLLAYPGLSWWLSPEFAVKALPIAIVLTIGIWFNAMAMVPYTMLHARGNTKITAQFHLAELLLYIGALYWLSKTYGLAGAATAWVARVMLDLLLLHLAAKRILTSTKE